MQSSKYSLHVKCEKTKAKGKMEKMFCVSKVFFRGAVGVECPSGNVGLEEAGRLDGRESL